MNSLRIILLVCTIGLIGCSESTPGPGTHNALTMVVYTDNTIEYIDKEISFDCYRNWIYYKSDDTTTYINRNAIKYFRRLK